MKEFKVTKSFKGYVSKKDKTNIGSQYLVSPSKNCYINDGEKVKSRPGYELYGASSTDTNPILWAFTWNTSTGTELPMRSYDDELEVYTGGAWTRVLDSWSDTEFDHATWWDNTEKEDVILLVNGNSNIYEWNGAIATISSTTSNTITKTGTETWGESRFYASADKTVIINGTEYTYTGGESTTTLTGVSPDPTGEANGSNVIQKPVTKTNKPASGFNNDVISVLNNQIYVADVTKRQVYISANDDYTDFTFSSPRVPGEGALITPDSAPRAFVPQEDVMYVSAGKDEWYKIEFKLSADLTKEIVEIKRLKTAPQQGARGNRSVGKIKNDAVFVSYETTVDSLGRIENVNTEQTKAISDPIKPDVDSYDYTTDPDVIYWRNQIWITIPSSSIVLIYDLERKHWQPPWTMGIQRFSIIGGDLYGHSSLVTESYKLFTGSNDNGGAIDSQAHFAYRNFNARAWLKTFDEYFTEGYIDAGTKLGLKINYDFDGYTSVVEKTIDGSDTAIIFNSVNDASIGKNPLGSEPVGSTSEDITELPKFRVKHELKKIDFFEYQPIYSTNEVDAQWEILAHGGNVLLSNNDSNDIKQ